MAAWRDDAACQGEDPELWFPIGYGTEFAPQIEKAKAICRGCPVRGECLLDALGRPERYGIFGGMTPDERAKQQRNARRRGWDGPMKTCARCEVPQPPSEFYRRKGRSDERDSYCRSCHIELVQERRTAKKEAVA